MQGAGVQLVYKFRPGAVYRYRCTTTGTMTMDLSKMGLPAGAGQPPATMPMDMAMQFDLVQRVKGVDADGSATVAQKIEAVAEFELNVRKLGVEPPKILMFKVEEVVLVKVELTANALLA